MPENMTALSADFGELLVIDRLGCPLHAWRTGKVFAPTLILLHGAGVDHLMWAPQIAALASTYQVISLDLRGHGASRPAGDYSFQALVDDCIALIDRLELKDAIFVGLSMGANVAQELAFRYPSRVRALVCMDCTCNTLAPWWDRQMLGFFLSLVEPVLAVYPKRALAKQTAEMTARTPEVRAYVEEAAAHFTNKELATIMTSLLAALHHEPGYRIALPLLLMRGAGDRGGNIASIMPKWASRDGAELVIVPAASHCANLDNPAFVNHTLLDWLARALAG
jgi:pimeloyl-ACP methyl ester carboxylesterase